MRLCPPRLIPSILLTAFAFAAPANAATFTVTRLDDPPPNGCAAGDCSLREAIIAANGVPGSTINLPAGIHTLTIPGVDNASTSEAIGDLDIRVATIINGSGPGTIVQAQQVAGRGIHRIFDNHSPANVRIANLTIRDGYDVEVSTGGCIRNLGVLTLDAVTITGCGSVNGGGISSFRSLTVVNSTITGNTARSDTGAVSVGGGISGGPGPVTGAASTVNITGSVISNNTVSSAGNVDLTALGGGFANTAVMNISVSTISGNTALNDAGGINTGTMTISETTITGNRARFDVGGIDNDSQMTISNSTFSNNQAGFNCVGTECNRAFAGGALNTAGGTMTVNNSTFSGNTCLASGGGILNAQGTLNINNSTFVGNTCRLSAGVGSSDVTVVKNTIVANNTATDPLGGDCGGFITSQGYNLIRVTTGCAISGDTTGNIIGQDPGVGPLQNNGGPTFTRALNPGSPARNAGNPANCTTQAGTLLQQDQRGFARGQEGRCDIGAFEFGVEAVVVHRLRHPSIGAYLFTAFPSERDNAQWQFGYLYEGICCNWLLAPAADGRTDLYRLYSGTAGEYFFTIFPQERDSAVSNFGYVFEGTAAYCYPSAVPGSTPWYRLRLGNKHIYTIYASERDAAVSLGYVLEGTSCHLPTP